MPKAFTSTVEYTTPRKGKESATVSFVADSFFGAIEMAMVMIESREKEIVSYISISVSEKAPVSIISVIGFNGSSNGKISDLEPSMGPGSP